MDRLIALFKERPGDYLSGEELSRQFGVSRTAIWKKIEQLRHDGYVIEAHPHRGYALTECPDALTADEVGWRLQSALIGSRILSYHTLESTNDTAYQLALQGAREGTVVFAEHQKKGRGRVGRRWISPRGSGVCVSIVLRPAISPREAPQLTLVAALALTRAIGRCCHLDSLIKWPNDIMVHDRKVAGILTEMKAEQDTIGFIVLGIGVNVHDVRRDLPEGATSLAQETGGAVGRVLFARELLSELDQAYRAFISDGFGAFHRELQALSYTTDRRVSVACRGRAVEGIAHYIDRDGALVIRSDTGLSEKIFAGDVMLVREKGTR